MYRTLQIHPGWTVDDYMGAPADYVDWALQFAQIEAEVAVEKQEAATRDMQRTRGRRR